MREPQPKTIYLKDYTPPAFRVETIELDVDIRDDHALVSAKLELKRNAPGPLVLDGDELSLVSVSLDGKEPKYSVTPEKLTIDLTSTAITFEAGHRIMLALTSSNAPRFEVNRNTGEDGGHAPPRVATNTVYMDRDHPTALVLPVAEFPRE